MERKKVNSSQLRSVGYDAGSQTLEVELYRRQHLAVHRRALRGASPAAGRPVERELLTADNIEEDFSRRRVK